MPGQSTVTGYRGKPLVNSFFDGDASEGSIISPEFTISKPYIEFLIGGGWWPYDPATTNTSSDTRVGVNHLVAGKVVQSGNGSNTENLEWRNWDVTFYVGKRAQIQIVDHNRAGFGPIDIDEVFFPTHRSRKPTGSITVLISMQRVAGMLCLRAVGMRAVGFRSHK